MTSRDILAQYMRQKNQYKLQEVAAALSSRAEGTTSTLRQPHIISNRTSVTETATDGMSNRFADTAIAPLPTIFSTASVAITAFTRFQELPPELRLMVWEHSAKSKRTITIRHSLPRGPWARLKAAHNATTVPGILHVCQESRFIGRKFYKLS
ncbi:hypothetical protein N431DRAFT_443443 [Stipitochalara longipes BDJ]|nr:hypothetical protein N431DRAFT_443443 [Stipitochalara longipes BDJ]